MPAVHLFWCTAVLAYLHEAGIRFSYFMAPAADWGHHLLPPKKINAKRRMTMYTALTIAGSDSSGGAGIQADLKTMTAHGVYGMSAITALTAQNTTGVTGIMEVSPEFLGEQLDDIFTDIFPDAVKIGMVSSAGLIEMIAGKLAFYQASHIVVDPVMAAAEGLTPTEIGSMVSQMLDGMEVTTLDIDGREVSVMAEYPEEDYRTVDQVKGIILTKPSGGYVALTDVAEIYFKDSPASISKTDKSFEITITADYTGGNVKSVIDSEVINPNLSGTITTGVNSRDKMMQEEFSALYKAIAIAVFMVFVVMAAQFESPKFSFMVMTTIPFSLVGSFGLLKVTGVTISMTSLLGFLVLVGTVVNNGILYVDTVNQYRMTMDLKTALIEAGATRLRPILMTSLTTILSMIPMALAIGSSGSTTQGLAVVNIGGLTAGVLVALFLLPIYYAVMNGNKKRVVLDI